MSPQRHQNTKEAGPIEMLRPPLCLGVFVWLTYLDAVVDGTGIIK